ncbi:hypothetical protein J8V12_18895 [Photorhabdus thracensis]|nr:hypothetical protein [Photorhabdus thracensis]
MFYTIKQIIRYLHICRNTKIKQCI